jgi:hypothetical protein
MNQKDQLTTLLLVLLSVFIVSCDDDGLTEGDPNYWTLSRGQFSVTLSNDSTMFFLKTGDSTATVTFDGSNPLHWTNSSTASASIITYVGDVVIPTYVTDSTGTTYKVTAVGNEAFLGNRKLTNVMLPSSIQNLGAGAFELCTTMASVNIPEGIDSIPTACFSRDAAMISFELPSTLTEIHSMAFYGCTSLTSITFPANVTSIGDRVFYLCSKLTEIHVEATTPPVLASAFFNTTDTQSVVIYVPQGSKHAYMNADYWNNYTIEEE